MSTKDYLVSPGKGFGHLFENAHGSGDSSGYGHGNSDANGDRYCFGFGSASCSGDGFSSSSRNFSGYSYILLCGGVNKYIDSNGFGDEFCCGEG